MSYLWWFYSQYGMSLSLSLYLHSYGCVTRARVFVWVHLCERYDYVVPCNVHLYLRFLFWPDSLLLYGWYLIWILDSVVNLLHIPFDVSISEHVHACLNINSMWMTSCWIHWFNTLNVWIKSKCNCWPKFTNYKLRRCKLDFNWIYFDFLFERKN